MEATYILRSPDNNVASADAELINKLTKEDMLAKYHVMMSHRQHKNGETAITFDYVGLDFALMNKEEVQCTARWLRKAARKGQMELRPEGKVAKVVEGKTWHILAIYEKSIKQFRTKPYSDVLARLMFDMQVCGLVMAFDQEKNRDSVYKFVMDL